MSRRRAQALPPIPRDSTDDHSIAPVAARRALWSRVAGADPVHVSGAPVPLASARGKIENLVGYAQVPLGLAGPLLVDTSAGRRELYVPMATTEGALVASYSRGMKLLCAGGGARARVLRRGLTQNPILVYRDAAAAERACQTARASLERWQKLVSTTTRHGALRAVEASVLGRRLVLQLVFTTGDAIGINMAARAAELVSADLEQRTKALERFVHGQDVEKRANARAQIEGRGRSVVADATIPRAALRELAHTTPEKLCAILDSYRVGFAELGTQNWLVQAANGLAAVFLACGQDLAYVGECATGQLDFAVDLRGDLYASVHLPALLVGTVGGGSGQGTAAECLRLMGCLGEGQAEVFAEILGATVLAGDLSLMAAFSSHEFVAAHERLGRNRPAGAPKREIRSRRKLRH
jgi:hydroxymethylglutaryl-CoA reductase (NADPH)